MDEWRKNLLIDHNWVDQIQHEDRQIVMSVPDTDIGRTSAILSIQNLRKDCGITMVHRPGFHLEMTDRGESVPVQTGDPFKMFSQFPSGMPIIPFFARALDPAFSGWLDPRNKEPGPMRPKMKAADRVRIRKQQRLARRANRGKK